MKFLGLISLSAGITLAVLPTTSGMAKRKAYVASVIFILAPVAIGPSMKATHLIQKLSTGSDSTSIPFLLENRHGIIHTARNDILGDAIFGGNLYDGRINIDPVLDSNRITRAYLLATLSSTPKRILQIGLSGGAWARVLSAFPGLEHMDIVEINPGYIKLVEQYDIVSPILGDSRISIHIDDGRRWLQHYHGVPYDIIVIKFRQDTGDARASRMD